MIKYGKSIPTLFFIFLPVVIYLVYTIANSASLFHADDFHLLKTVLWMQDVSGFSAKLDFLMQQHNEHRILFPRLLTWLDYKIEGSINWKTLILIGNLIWVANLYFFWEGFKSLKAPAWMFVAIPFIFLQPQYTDNVTWAISILQQSVVVFWFSLLAYLYSKNKYYWALLIAVVATFTHGNGIFSFFIGIILASLDRKWRVAIIWGLAWLVVGMIYFWGFHKGQAADFEKSLSDPIRLLGAFVAFFGAVTQLRSVNVIVSVAMGTVLVGVLAFYLLPKLQQKVITRNYHLADFDKMLFGIVLFLGITAALICVSRSWGGIETVLAPRYQHYSPFVLCWAYIVFLSFFTPKIRHIFALMAVVSAVLFNALCYFTYNHEVQLRKNWLVADQSNWQQHEVMLNYVKTLNINIWEPYKRAVAVGICSSKPILPAIPQSHSGAVSDHKLLFSTKVIHELDVNGTHPHNYQQIISKTITGRTFLYLESQNGDGYWIATRVRPSGIIEFLTTGRLSKNGFEAEFMTENLPTGNYNIGLLNNNKFSWTPETVQIQ
jgi:hypothetical protein